MRSAKRVASKLSGRGPWLWMLPLYLHVNQKSDYDDDDDDDVHSSRKEWYQVKHFSFYFFLFLFISPHKICCGHSSEVPHLFFCGEMRKTVNIFGLKIGLS